MKWNDSNSSIISLRTNSQSLEMDIESNEKITWFLYENNLFEIGKFIHPGG